MKTRTTQAACKAAIGLVLIAGLSYGGVAVATSTPETPEPAAEATALSPQLSQHFAAFRTGSTASAADVATLTESEMATGENRQFGLNATLAVSVKDSEGASIWLIPGSNGLCIYRADSGQGACTSIENALAGRLVMALGGTATEGPALYGVVPDGNPSVRLHSANDASHSVSVTNNVYVVKNSDAKTISLVTAAGQEESTEAP